MSLHKKPEVNLWKQTLAFIFLDTFGSSTQEWTQMLVNVGYKWYTTSSFFPLWIPYFLRRTVYASFKYYWFSHLVILCFFIVLLLSHLCMSFVSIYFISCFILEAVCSSSVLFCFISPACCLDCVQLPHLFLLLFSISCVYIVLVFLCPVFLVFPEFVVHAISEYLMVFWILDLLS